MDLQLKRSQVTEKTFIGGPVLSNATMQVHSSGDWSLCCCWALMVFVTSSSLSGLPVPVLPVLVRDSRSFSACLASEVSIRFTVDLLLSAPDKPPPGGRMRSPHSASLRSASCLRWSTRALRRITSSAGFGTENRRR